MNKLIKIAAGLAFLFGVSMTPLMADSSDFAGAYVGIQGSAVGVELDGNHKSAQDDVGETTTGTIGKVALIAGAEIGYAFPVSDTFLIDLGGNYVAGDAKIKTSNTDTAATADVTFEVGDMLTAYIAPTFAVSDTASIYLKAGYVEAETKATGDVTQPADLEGVLIGVGSRSLLGNGMFMRTEAGLIDFDGISVKGKGAAASEAISTSTSVTADPKVAYGSVTIGYKF